MSASQYLRKVLFLVGSERRRMAFLLPLYLVSSLADLLGIGMLVALITMLKNTDTVIEVTRGIPLLEGYARAGMVDQLLIILSAGVLLVYAVKTAIAFFANKLTLELSFRYGAKLRAYLMAVYQGQSYARYIQRNSADYIYNIQTMAGRVVSYAVQPLLHIVGDGFVMLMIIIYLALEDPFVLACLLVLMGIAGVLYDRAFRKKMALYGSQENHISADMIRHITEGLTGYKESHIFGIVRFFHAAVARSARQLADARIRSQLITTSARFMLEFIIVISVVLIISAALAAGRDKDELLTTLALFLVASMRLVPAANQVVTSIGKLRYGRHAVEVLHADIRQLAGAGKVDFAAEFHLPATPPAELGDAGFTALKLQDVSFRYTTDGPWVLDSIGFTVARHEIVGIVGSSGSGKTTLIALMLGLLAPQRGKVLYDDRDLADAANVRAWHRKVAYLPQEVFLVDDSVARNVALGVEDERRDMERLLAALEKARLKEMVDGMPGGVDAPVGEKGLRISGGQRQRVALARAFYHDSEVLVLDESTSALDAETADEIISELRHLKGKVTIIVITHQQALLSLCDKVYRLESGNLTHLPG